MFNTGEVVRFREPLTREEEGERFEVLEMRGGASARRFSV